MRTKTTAVFRNGEADFSQYENEDIEFRILAIGRDEPDKITVFNSLRDAVRSHIDYMTENTSLNRIAMKISVYTDEGRYLADIKADVTGFQDAREEEIADFTKNIYRKIGVLIPCMEDVVPS